MATNDTDTLTCDFCAGDVARADATFIPEPDGAVLDVLCGRCAALPRIRIAERRRCFCPDDCWCRTPWRPNLCGCKNHEETR
jgi:hypothetical protein